MHCVYANLVVILVELLQYIIVQLYEVRLEDLVFIKRERIFDCHVLNVSTLLDISLNRLELSRVLDL